MKKRMYRKMPVNGVCLDRILEDVPDGRVTVAVDVAKVDMVAAIGSSSGEVLRTVSWKSPGENVSFVRLLRALQTAGVWVEVVMEPTGSYGDVLRHQLHREGVPVYRVEGKRTCDAKELLDGVPSLHDAKSAAVLILLHKNGLSSLWGEEDEARRRLKATIQSMDIYREQFQRLQGKLEGELARYWPELGMVADVGSASVLALLARVGGPSDVARQPAKARRLLRSMSHGLMNPQRIEDIVASAAMSVGVPPINEERNALMELAGEAHRVLKALKRTRGQVEKLSSEEVSEPVQKMVGKTTAAVFTVDIGDPCKFCSARAYVKAYGMNLKEKSSGKKQGVLQITKRGPARARQYLWLAALRWLQEDSVVRAWYAKKVARDGGTRKKAVVALMRKLAKAIYVVAKGETLDSTRLFDTTSLRITN